ncbi:hypothetical protein GCM10023113_21420 [Cellulomonas oligotrophica]|uniref:Integrase catalytic domain-containing protein n=1 Tax=Cellulomonas oligotrophica TaxID=931536 RepID=A0ABQ4DEI4_9CELL|nr:hypothetical protein Col01nite_32830 [Cellulomonas oligotrophica]
MGRVTQLLGVKTPETGRLQHVELPAQPAAGPAPRRAVAPGHDQGLDRGAGAGLPARRGKLLHPRGRRLDPGPAHTHRRGDRLRRGRRPRTLGHPGRLTLGTDNGSQFTSPDFREHLSARGITRRRGGSRDLESQAFIGAGFGQFTKRCAWLTGWETVEAARAEITADVDAYRHRPHSGPAHRTPAEVARTWADPEHLHTTAT